MLIPMLSAQQSILLTFVERKTKRPFLLHIQPFYNVFMKIMINCLFFVCFLGKMLSDDVWGPWANLCFPFSIFSRSFLSIIYLELWEKSIAVRFIFCIAAHCKK